MPTQSMEIIQKAQLLAEQVVSTTTGELQPTQPSTPTFMMYRPNSLTECYQHGQAVAKILADWQADAALQAAGLLHSFVYRDILPVQQIAETCGDRAAFLCQKYRDILQQVPEKHHGKPLVIKRVKLFVAAYCDPALAFLGAASLWEHFILARQSELTLQRLFAEEAEEVLIPLLDLLGMANLQADVEEWVMQWGKHQQDYRRLVKRLIQTEDTRQQVFEMVKKQLHPMLPSARLDYKFPTPVAIYNPQFPEKAHPESFQRVTVDVLVNTEEECYTALRWIHRFWEPVEQNFVDHIGISKLNGDRYLLTTVVVSLGNNPVRTEFNIRTFEIEQINQWGLTAILLQNQQPVELSKVWWSNRQADYAKICSAPLGTLPETLYVFSPHGEVFKFHRGCTVVDYAYQVHSELAHQCKRFKINGEAVSPTTALRHLDLVELEQDPKFSGPNRAWLTAAHTNRARSHIERFLKRQNQGHLHGRALLNRRLQELAQHFQIDIPEHRVEQALTQSARRHNFESVESLLAEIAAGRVAIAPILNPLFSQEVTRQVELPNGARLLPHQLSLAQCCKPKPGDDIIGRARYHDDQMVRLKVHRASCQRISNLQNDLTLKWRLQPQLNVVARIEMTALAEDNLLYDALQIFQNNMPHITLHKVDAQARNGLARLNFTVEATNQSRIDKITQTLENLPNYSVNEVRQMQLLFSEREELVKPVNPARYNPYRRQPVQDRDMFFGRTEEVNKVVNLLGDNIGVIFVQGQKRVGKTSLLLHLKRHYLKRHSIVPIFVDFQLLSSLDGLNFHFEVASTIYNDLQTDNRINNLEPPLRELFEIEPTTQLIDYLNRVQSQFGARKLVLLIDEFSRTIDAYQQSYIEDSLFYQWRGVIQATTPQVSYVMVVQQQTYNHLQEYTYRPAIDPVWHLLELGETIMLKPLSQSDAHQLIERPTFNYLDYTPNAIRYVWRLTGGRAFLIHAFCFNLVRHMAHCNRRRVEWDDVHAVQAEFMHPHESVFAHLVDVIQDIPKAGVVCRELAQSIDDPKSITDLSAALSHIPLDQLRAILKKLIDQHIIAETAPDVWEFTSLLFGRWLAINLGQIQHASH